MCCGMVRIASRGVDQLRISDIIRADVSRVVLLLLLLRWNVGVVQWSSAALILTVSHVRARFGTLVLLELSDRVLLLDEDLLLLLLRLSNLLIRCHMVRLVKRILLW